MGFLSTTQASKNGEYLQEEFRYYVRKDVFRVCLESETHGLFQRKPKSQKMHVFAADDILRALPLVKCA